MTAKRLTRESEKYSHYGNISADGIQKLLGAPNLDRLQTVIRESVQNSWDARDDGCIPIYKVHLRQLTNKQVNVLKNQIFSDLPNGGEDDAIKNYLSRGEHWVLELGDYGTTGLGGSTDPSLVPDNESTDFVDFLRNIGTPRDTDKGGGTYGYGKSCLYSFSHCSTILVDSATRYRDKNTRRLMGCRIGHRFDIRSGIDKGRYTGRHWWGTPRGSGISPVAGKGAGVLARSLGVLEREESEYGTTIMILGPDVDTDNPSKAIKAIAHALLWNFWPKMIVDQKTKQPGMMFEIWLNGEQQELLIPDECPPLNVFADAMRKLKSGKGEKIRCGSPKKLLGELAVVKAPVEERHAEFGSDSEASFPDSINHVALMRPAELVVKYLEGPTLPGSGEWGGVFICDENDDVESAFAASEPPAHDDWVPNNLPKGKGKTFVRVALRNINREVDKIIGNTIRNVESDDIPMSRASNFLGNMLVATKGDRLGAGKQKAPTGSKGKKGNSKTNKIHIKDLKFENHEIIEDKQCMLFSFMVTGPDGRLVRIIPKAGVLLDGGQIVDAIPSGEKPEVVAWYNKNKENISSDSSYIEYKITNEGRLFAAISLPSSIAVSFNVSAEAV